MPSQLGAQILAARIQQAQQAQVAQTLAHEAQLTLARREMINRLANLSRLQSLQASTTVQQAPPPPPPQTVQPSPVELLARMRTQLPMPSLQPPPLGFMKPNFPALSPKSPSTIKTESEKTGSAPSTPVSTSKSPDLSPTPPKLHFPVFDHNPNIQKLLLQKIGQAALEQKQSEGKQFFILLSLVKLQSNQLVSG